MRNKDVIGFYAALNTDGESLTIKQAQTLIEEHNIIHILDTEFVLLEDQNPDLLDAYLALHRIVYGTHVKDTIDQCKKKRKKK